MDVLLDAPRFVAVDKPPGWLSVPSRWGARDERSVAGLVLQERIGCRLWPVHRLDEEATGLLLFARDAEAHAEAGRWFEHALVVKTYEALTERPTGAELPAPGPQPPWRSLLLRGKKRAYESPHGKPSETRATFAGVVTIAGADALAWELQPVTGRPHQLRVELARRGFPILGDALYGSTRAFPEAAIALRCVALRFPAEPAAALALPLELRAPSLREWMHRREDGA